MRQDFEEQALAGREYPVEAEGVWDASMRVTRKAAAALDLQVIEVAI